MALLPGAFSSMLSNFNGSSGIGGILSAKNAGLGAVASLGIGEGDLLSQQLKDREEEMKKKRQQLELQRSQYPDVGSGTSLLGASSLLFGMGA